MPRIDPHHGHRILSNWVAGAARRAGAVVVLALIATVAAGHVTATRLGINTDTTDMLSAELPFRRNDAAMRAAFPQFTDVLSIVVEADTPDRAEDAAAALATDLAQRPALFRSVYYAEGDPFFRRNGLLYLDLAELRALSDRLAEAQPLLASLAADPSLRGLAQALRQALEQAPDDGADALVPILARIAGRVRAVAAAEAGAGVARPLSWIALLSGKTPTPADKRRFLVVQPVLDYASLQPAARAIEAVRARAAALGVSAEAGVRVRLTGSPVMFQDELRSVQSGMGVVALLSAVLVAGLLAVGLRNPRLIGAVLATLVMGLAWTAGFATLAIGEVNLISVAFAVLFIGLSVDFGIHYALRYQEAAQGGDPGGTDSGAALLAAARGVGGPLTLCAVAAAIGFFAFLPTSYRGLSELGLISGVGMFIALFANLTVLPALLRLLPVKGGRGASAALGAGARLQTLVTGRPRAVIAGALAIGIGALGLAPFARFDDDPLNLRDPKSESVATLVDLIGDPRVEPYSADVLSADLASAEALAARLEQVPEVAAAITLADYLPDRQDEKLAIVDEIAFFLAPVFQGAAASPAPDAAARRRSVEDLRASLRNVEGTLGEAAADLADALDALNPDDQALAALEAALLGGLPARLDALAEALRAGPVTLADLPAILRDRNVATDGRAKVEIVPREDLRDAAARRRFVDAIQAVAPEASGAPVTITEAGRAVVRAFAEAAGYAVLLIAGLLLAVLRSVRDSAMVLAPLALAAVLTVAATVVFAVPFNFANVIVLPLLFGLGVAGGIHVVTRARDAGAAAVMATSTPRAVLLSALTTIASFGALAVSSHRGMSSMGVLLTVAIGLTLLCTLIVLPALLALARRA